MNAILAAAEQVKAAVEEDEGKRFVDLTQAELDGLYTYQSTLPTNPKPGFRYKKKWWRNPKDGRLWTGPSDVWGSKLDWPVVWIVYDVVLSNKPGYVDHKPREARII